MKRKTLIFLVIALGVVYLALAVIGIYEYREIARVFMSYGVPEFDTFEDIASVRRSLLGGAIVCSVLGAVTLSVGTGLYLEKRWAERAWLVFTILLLCAHLIRLVEVFNWGAVWVIERIIELVLVGVLAMFSWKVLSTPTAKSLPSTSAT